MKLVIAMLAASLLAACQPMSKREAAQWSSFGDSMTDASKGFQQSQPKPARSCFVDNTGGGMYVTNCQ